MRMNLMLCFSLLVGSSVLAEEHEHNHHKNAEKSGKQEKRMRRHGAHEHGSVTVSLAIDEKKARLTWDSPAEAVYGFEHTAKTNADKKQQAAGLAKLENAFFTMFAFPKDAGCELRKVEHEVKAEETLSEEEEMHHTDDHAHENENDHGKEGKRAQKRVHKHHSVHAEVAAEFDLECKKTLAGTELNVDIAKVFPNVKKVRVKTLSGTKQGAKSLDRGKGTIKL